MAVETVSPRKQADTGIKKIILNRSRQKNESTDEQLTSASKKITSMAGRKCRMRRKLESSLGKVIFNTF